MAKPDREHRLRRERWRTIVADYQRRHRQWTMAHPPSMPESSWHQYLHWVAAFGALRPGQAVPQARRFKRRMKEAKKHAVVTAAVTAAAADLTASEAWSHATDAMDYLALTADRPGRVFIPARGGGKVAQGLARATRRK